MDSVSSPVTHLADAKRKPDPEVVEALEGLLERARNGEMLGFVAFGVHVENVCSCHDVGDTDMGATLVAFESWKLDKLRAGGL